jgi:DNA-binding transcriptional MerR regulator
MPAAARYAIGDLATLGGVSRRTVRYYVQEGLIPAPLGLGRGNHYTADHLDQLLRVKAMQEAGRTLDEVRRALGQAGKLPRAGQPPHEEPAQPRSLWRRIALVPGVELHVASTARLPPPVRLRELADWCRLHCAEARDTDDIDADHKDKDEDPHA